MRKGLIYLLMTVFLLFIAENKQSLDFQQDFGNQNFSLHLFSFAKKHRLNHSLEKNSFQQINDSLDSPEENSQIDLNFNHLNAFTLFAIGFGYILNHILQRRKLFFYNSAIIRLPARRFILLRNIRI
ncbi:hypothetical protein [Epilithonimonas sp.]|uniref:hypothetical protein n=1 Tax=Epilithonimonas sp. TaxID=2894511 RepID=UPI0035B0F9D0